MILTKELYEKGLLYGRIICKEQRAVLGRFGKHHKRFAKKVIGLEISEETYKRFLELKMKPRKRLNIKKVKDIKNTVLKPDGRLKLISFDELKDYAEKNESLEPLIKKMKYNDFLKTQYWRSITKYMKEIACNKCSCCGSDKTLQVHHKTYKHHGKEIFYLNDLVVLCRKCHTNEHERLKQEKVNTKEERHEWTVRVNRY